MPIATIQSASSRSTVPGHRPGAVVIPVGASAKPALTPRQLARARAKLEHAASGHASVAAAHRASAAAAPPDEAAASLRMAAAHDKIVEDYAKKSAALK